MGTKKYSGRKKRRKKQISELFLTDHYRSIILLTKFYDKGKGLRQLHYRWALVKNHGNIYFDDYHEEIETIFGENKEMYRKMGFRNRLEYDYRDKVIIKDCISSNNNLFNFLQKLVDDYGLLEKTVGEKDVLWYRLTQKGVEEAYRWYLRKCVDWFPPEYLGDVEKVLTQLFNEKMGERQEKLEKSLGAGSRKDRM